ncbi:hypothetical protein [Pararhizobium sp. PWRC1-1]|uniref:hypothetical protein n=1 Tax=Pararhizobium sp. PWRC1-1 TaxID=2804566 RepID=UPI003CF3B4A9
MNYQTGTLFDEQQEKRDALKYQRRDTIGIRNSKNTGREITVGEGRTLALSTDCPSPSLMQISRDISRRRPLTASLRKPLGVIPPKEKMIGMMPPRTRELRAATWLANSRVTAHVKTILPEARRLAPGKLQERKA